MRASKFSPARSARTASSARIWPPRRVNDSPSPGRIRTTTPGPTQDVSFALNATKFVNLVNQPSTGFVTVTKQFTATGGDTFTVGFRNDPSFNFVDGFSIKAEASAGIFVSTLGNGNLFVGDTRWRVMPGRSIRRQWRQRH